MTKNGFTLIEVLLVASIISLVSSIAFTSFQDARADARDAKKVQEQRSVKQAVEVYRNDHGSYPALNSAGNGVVPANSSNASVPSVAKEEQDDTNGKYSVLMDGLVEEGYLAEKPESENEGYAYINTGESTMFQVKLNKQSNAGGGSCSVMNLYVENPNKEERAADIDFQRAEGGDIMKYDLEFNETEDHFNLFTKQNIDTGGVELAFWNGGGTGGSCTALPGAPAPSWVPGPCPAGDYVTPSVEELNAYATEGLCDEPEESCSCSR